MMLKCPKCEHSKNSNEFHKNKFTTSGFSNYCKEHSKVYRQSEKYKASQKKYRQSEKYKASQKKYRQSENYEASQKKYRQSEKCKITRKKCLHLSGRIPGEPQTPEYRQELSKLLKAKRELKKKLDEIRYEKRLKRELEY